MTRRFSKKYTLNQLVNFVHTGQRSLSDLYNFGYLIHPDLFIALGLIEKSPFVKSIVGKSAVLIHQTHTKSGSSIILPFTTSYMTSHTYPNTLCESFLKRKNGLVKINHYCSNPGYTYDSIRESILNSNNNYNKWVVNTTPKDAKSHIVEALNNHFIHNTSIVGDCDEILHFQDIVNTDIKNLILDEIT